MACLKMICRINSSWLDFTQDGNSWNIWLLISYFKLKPGRISSESLQNNDYIILFILPSNTTPIVGLKSSNWCRILTMQAALELGLGENCWLKVAHLYSGDNKCPSHPIITLLPIISFKWTSAKRQRVETLAFLVYS